MSREASKGALRSFKNDCKALPYLPFFMSQRGDSGQMKTCSMTSKAGMHALPSISRQFNPVIETLAGSLTRKSTKLAALPSIIPKAVHVCHCITRAPRMRGGEHSAAYTGTVADLGPIPKPRKKREMNKCHQVSVTPCHTHVAKLMNDVKKIVPRRPRKAFNGSVSQQPRNAQQMYGADETRPTSQLFLLISLSTSALVQLVSINLSPVLSGPLQFPAASS